MADANNKQAKVQIKMETVVDKKQIKSEVDTAQSVANANAVTIPTKVGKIVSKDVEQEVKTVQKKTKKIPLYVTAKLQKHDLQEELNKLVKQKGKSQKEIRIKLDDIMKDMDLSDAIKESIKDLFIKYRSIANSKGGFSSASTKSKKELVKLATSFSRKTENTKSNTLVRALTELTSGQAQTYRNEHKTKARLQEVKQEITKDVMNARAKKDAAKLDIQNAAHEQKKAEAFVEGRIDPNKVDPEKKDQKPKDIRDKPILETYNKILDELAKSKLFIMSQTNNGENEKATEFWGHPDEYNKYIDYFQDIINKGLEDYTNKEEFVPKAKEAYEKISMELDAIETEALKRLAAIEEVLGPTEKFSIDPSNITAGKYGELFKTSLSPRKFKMRKRTLTDDVADAAINRDYLKQLRRGASRAQAAVPGSDTNLGLRESIMDGPYIDRKRIIRTAIGGPHVDTNSYERTAAETQKASRELAAKTFKQFIASVQELRTYLDNLHGNNKNNLTEAEKNRQLSQIATNQTVKEQKRISKGSATADIQAFEDTLRASFGFLTKSFGPSIWKGLSQNVNAIMSQFAGGLFKISNDKVKGEGKNYAQLAKILSEHFKDINEFFAKNPEMEQLAEVARQLKTAAELGQDAFEQALTDNAKILQSFGYNPGRSSVGNTNNRSASTSSSNTMLAKHMENLNKGMEKQTGFIKLGNMESEEITDAIKLTDTTGADSDAGKNEIVEATKSVGTTIGDVFSTINGNNFGGGNGGNGGSNDLGDTGPSILEQIRDLLVNISAYTTAIFDILPKLKLTIKREKRSKKKDQIPSSDVDGAFLPMISGELKDRTDEVFQAIRDSGKIIFQDITNPAKLRHQRAVSDANLEYENMENYYKDKKFSKVGLSKVISSTMEDVRNSIKKIFGSVTTSETEVERLKNLNQKDRERELAERRRMFGIADSDRNASATGDKGRAFRMKSVYGYRQSNSNPFKDLKLTPGLEIDTKGITQAFQTMLEKSMFSAQTGVSGLGDLIKLSFGGIGMPSLEKSRAQSDAANEILSIIRQSAMELLQSIQDKETNLRGMVERGDAKFNDQGIMVSGSDEAWTLFGQLEESKMALNGIIAEMGMMDQLSEATGGNMAEFFRVLSFVSPELRRCNGIIENINAGLDKNGKAIKFQSRFQETLNYSFQLLTRHVGQMVKNWLMTLNPLAIVEKAFSDFASYDVKWQRTMNVIKYNIRSIIRPFVEWLAQQFVNILGLVNALVKGIGTIFGKKWDLFDKTAASAEKTREEMEAVADVSAGFDELHDVGGDPANDLSGDIYTPQWEGLNKTFEDIGKVIGNIGKMISKMSFWDWLKLAGAALVGFVALKFLINWFTGKNPLQSVATGFKTLQTTVGWAILITAFTMFTNTLKDFITTIAEMNPWAVVGALTTLAVGFGIVVGAIWLLSKAVTSDWKALLGMSVLVGVFTGLTAVLIPFINALKEVTSEQLRAGLEFFATAMLSVAAAVGALALIFTAVATTGIGLAALGILAGILAVTALVILAMAELVRAMGESGAGIKLILEGIAIIIEAIGAQLTNYMSTVGDIIIGVVDAIANGIKTVLEPILGFIDGIIGKIVELAATVAREIGETIRTIIKTTGDVVIGIIDALLGAIPRLLDAILRFVREIGPAIENSTNAIMRTITKLINFVISGIEYMINTLLIGTINKAISSITFGVVTSAIGKVSVPRFVPQYEQGTNYVPNDGLAYLHQGEAVVPKKYNQPYQQGLSNEERAYMQQMINTMRSLDGTMKQGINVNGQFVQRGSDLVAVVNKTKSQTGADLLSNVAYAR